MKSLRLKIVDVRRIKKDIYRMALFSPALARKALPGQFLHIRIKSEKVLLRRPFSVHKVDKSSISILFKVRGTATNILSLLKKGVFLDVLGPLGNSFSYSFPRFKEKAQSVILVAGGIGVAPLVFLAEKIKHMPSAELLSVSVLLGAKTKSEILCEKDFKKMGCLVYVATEDGSIGFKGTATGLLKKILIAKRFPLSAGIYACGPQEMLRSLSVVLKKFPDIKCEASFEQFMGCGIGICCGCAIESKTGYKKVCEDGPVFNLRDIY